jgi:hypothetical protein
MNIKFFYLLLLVSTNLFGQGALKDFERELQYTPLFFENQKMEFSIKIDSSTYLGSFYVSGNIEAFDTKDISYYQTIINDEEKEKINRYLKGIVAISNASYRVLIYPMLLKELQCENLPDRKWKFISKDTEINTFLGANRDDSYSFIVCLNEQGYIKQITSSNNGDNPSTNPYETETIYQTEKNKTTFTFLKGHIYLKQKNNNLFFEIKLL